MSKESISQEFRLKWINIIMIKKLMSNELISKNPKSVSKILNHTGNFLIFASAITGCVVISAIAKIFNWYSFKYWKYCSNNKNLCRY